MAPKDQVVLVTRSIIRQKFVKADLLTLIRNGTLIPKYLKDKEISNPEPYQGPEGTRSQIIRYTDASGMLIVVVHQYLRPDGTLGASGLPDPKRLREGNIIYYVL